MEEREKDKQGSAQSQDTSKENIPLPDVTFAAFILSLNTSALVHLGEIPEPGKDEVCEDLVLAKHAIDTIAMLKEKTAGNLTEEEQTLIDNILFDLRMKFVKKAG
ncbi:MAG: DUF1844 domain-containing protein [Thermodesulfobacteria bacterium]|nr:DUF1844 domain-containing protein [Thermodesulfobacteriota bacterium]